MAEAKLKVVNPWDLYLIFEWEDTLWADGLMEPLNRSRPV